ncbi:MAG: beta-ACP synthase, partial [Pararhodobacter sp.]|nr:beta-ACP synthase [Pararhodobacter sp.]
MRRVAITGAGSVNALALDVPGTWAALAEARIGIGPLDFADVDRLTIRIGGQIRDWQAETRFARQEIALFDRATQFAVVAAAQATAQAGLTLTEGESLRAGVVMGTAGGGYTTIDDSYRTVYPQGKNRVHPFTIPRLMHNAAAAHLAMRHGLRGPAFTVSTACASSNHAMGQAFQMVRAGVADVMLTGGAEAT